MSLAALFFPISGETGTIVRVETSLGNFSLNLFDETTPDTVANFLNYVISGRYEDSIVHRSEPNFVIQGGGWMINRESNSLARIQTDDSIPNEFNISNTRGTVAMAKLPTDPDSATSQWFINLTDNLSLDSSNGGFTVFGEVLGNGMDVVDAIGTLPKVALSQSIPDLPVNGFNGSTVTIANLVVVRFFVLPNVYDEIEERLIVSVDAQEIGQLRVAFSVLSVEEGLIQALSDTVETLSAAFNGMASFDPQSARLNIPEIAVNGEIAFRDVEFVLIDSEQLIFKLESIGN